MLIYVPVCIAYYSYEDFESYALTAACTMERAMEVLKINGFVYNPATKDDEEYWSKYEKPNSYHEYYVEARIKEINLIANF